MSRHSRSTGEQHHEVSTRGLRREGHRQDLLEDEDKLRMRIMEGEDDEEEEEVDESKDVEEAMRMSCGRRGEG